MGMGTGEMQRVSARCFYSSVSLDKQILLLLLLVLRQTLLHSQAGLPASASYVLGLQAHASRPGIIKWIEVLKSTSCQDSTRLTQTSDWISVYVGVEGPFE